MNETQFSTQVPAELLGLARFSRMANRLGYDLQASDGFVRCYFHGTLALFLSEAEASKRRYLPGPGLL